MSGVSTFLEDLAERVQPSGVGRTVDDKMALVRIALSSGFVVLLNIAILTVIHFGFGEPEAAALDLIAATSYVTAFVVFLSTGSVRLYAGIAIWVSLASVIASHIVLGGYLWSGGFVLWGLINILVGALWLGRRTTYALTSLWVVAAALLVVFESTFQSWRDPTDPQMAVLTLFMIFLTTLAILLPTILILVARIFEERAATRALLLNILPESIADRLTAGPHVIADHHESCSILFADLVGFTAHSRQIDADRLVGELNTIFSAFDRVVLEHGGEKIKTIGDGYMAAFGVPDDLEGHAEIACDVGLQLVDVIADLNDDLGTSFEIRVGIGTGPVIAGVIGESKFSYDLWSDTVILASRLETASRPGAVLVSEQVAVDAGERFDFEPLGSIELKGRPPTPAFVATRV